MAFLTLGLTGPTGAGKTTVSSFFSKKDIPSVNCDLLSRKVVEPGQPALKELVPGIWFLHFASRWEPGSSRLGGCCLSESIKQAPDGGNSLSGDIKAGDSRNSAGPVKRKSGQY